MSPITTKILRKHQKVKDYVENKIKIKHKLPLILISLWIILLLFMPYIDQNYSDESFVLSITFSVILQVSAVLSILVNSIGIRKTVFVATGVIFITWLIEAIGVATGFPFGRYNYTDKLQPQLLNVPLLIPLAWLMMLPSSWAIAQRITRQHKGIKFVIVSSLAITAWDLVLDPQMVEWGIWAWHNPDGYFGIPFTNFLGWFLSAIIVTSLIRPPKLDDKYLLVIYTLVWITEPPGLIFFWYLWKPAIFGSVGMGIFVFLAYFIKPRVKT